MALFDDLSKKIGKTGQGALKKTREFADTTKIYSKISDLESSINDIFIILGKEYFKKYKDREDDEFIDYIAEIKNSLLKINDYNDEIRKIKGETVCPNCGSTVKLNSTFCFKCGEKLMLTDENEKEIKRFCSSCGAELEENSEFCSNCGVKAE